MGHAVRMAALSVRAQLLEIAGRVFGVDPADLSCCDAAVACGDGRRLTLRALMLERFAMQAGNLVGVGSYAPSYEKADPETGQSSDITPFWMLGGAGAEIAVDMETGRITVTKLVNVADVGRAINPSIVERQLIGAAIMQAGFTLFEEMILSDGQVLNKIPGFLDLPEDLSAAYVDVPHEDGPFGAKGVGETGVFSPAPAIANALYDAIGVVVTDLPLTPERVLRAIRKAEGRPMEDD
jgi:CO/xanthine dehydrogenase Mo-binding subunit